MDDARLGNVAGALLLGGADSASAQALDAARLLDSVFEETLLVGDDAPAGAPGRRVADPPGPPCALRGLVGALAAAEAQRVVVVTAVDPPPVLDLILALTAWPEHDAVVPVDAGQAQPLHGIYRRERVLESARARLAGPDVSLAGWLDAIEVDRVTLERLGLADLAPIRPEPGAPSAMEGR